MPCTPVMGELCLVGRAPLVTFTHLPHRPLGGWRGARTAEEIYSLAHR